MEVLGLYQDALAMYSKNIDNLNQVTDEYEVYFLLFFWEKMKTKTIVFY